MIAHDWKLARLWLSGTASLLAILGLARRGLQAEEFNIRGEKYSSQKIEGRIAKVGPDNIEVSPKKEKDPKKTVKVWVSKAALDSVFAGQTAVTKRPVGFRLEVSGSGNVDSLKRDQVVEFTVQFDAHKNATEDVESLTIRSLDDLTKLEMSDLEPSVEETKATTFKSGNYSVTGKIVSVGKKYELKVSTILGGGKKPLPVTLTVHASPRATVQMRMADLNMADTGDTVEVQGFSMSKAEGQILGEIIKIDGSRSANAGKRVAKVEPKLKQMAKDQPADAVAKPRVDDEFDGDAGDQARQADLQRHVRRRRRAVGQHRSPRRGQRLDQSQAQGRGSGQREDARRRDRRGRRNRSRKDDAGQEVAGGKKWSVVGS